jgi:hypothetical protein
MKQKHFRHVVKFVVSILALTLIAPMSFTYAEFVDTDSNIFEFEPLSLEDTYEEYFVKQPCYVGPIVLEGVVSESNVVELSFYNTPETYESYIIERAQGTNYTVVASVLYGLDTFIDTTVKPDITYHYRVSNGAVRSNPLTITVSPTNQTSQITARALSGSTIELSFEGIRATYIERKTEVSEWEILASGMEIIDSTFIDSNVDSGNTYHYRIVTESDSYSNTVSINAPRVGDTNNDGSIDETDYDNLDEGYTFQEEIDWLHGDFDENGVINGFDYKMIDTAYNNCPR